MKIILLLIFVLGINAPGSFAQESLNASGSNALGSGGSVSYSVGQVVYTANTSSSGSENQGVQQPFEFYITGIQETNLAISLSVFPNPTLNTLMLQIQDYNSEKMSYQLFEPQGKLLADMCITSDQTRINMSDLPAGAYFLNIVQDKRKIQTFRVIKN